MKLNCFLICDDIRNELGNKQSLTGIYDDVISVCPQSLLLCGQTLHFLA